MRPVSTKYDLIRLGSPHDGGYLVPDCLVGIQACFSLGVSKVANFELDLTQSKTQLAAEVHAMVALSGTRD
jgi:hypothetical protein